MRYLPFILFSSCVLAHPGHGKPGLLHFHEFSDGLMVVAFVAAIALACWAWKK